ncbi:hypothetical protein [Hymenobacter psoromatis]|uniref:hypothetical protein n=1 Tax=Hymenobacter psoromatis TaxID=1484116 RepID=UPI001CBF97D4|nr:hypothetical protein [Hymenobacter psoromatis]
MSSKTAGIPAAPLAVRLPQLTSSALGLPVLAAKAARPTPLSPVDKRARQRADQSRYQAQCRAAMLF